MLRFLMLVDLDKVPDVPDAVEDEVPDAVEDEVPEVQLKMKFQRFLMQLKMKFQRLLM